MMKLRKTLCAALVLAVCCLAGACASQQVSGSVATDGSTSMQKVIGALGEDFTNKNPQVNFTYNPTGSGSGITAVGENRCDIGLSSRALKEAELAAGLAETVLAYDGIAVVVNPNNAVSDITVEQLAKVYTGEITNWSELGGDDSEIVLIGREAGSGTRDGFESVTDTKDRCAYRQELTSTGDVIATVSRNPSAIGYASLASVDAKVKALTVGGVAPSDKTILDGTYALSRPFMLITRADAKPSEAVKAFMEYALGDEAAKLITLMGAVPANGSDAE